MSWWCWDEWSDSFVIITKQQTIDIIIIIIIYYYQKQRIIFLFLRNMFYKYLRCKKLWVWNISYIITIIRIIIRIIIIIKHHLNLTNICWTLITISCWSYPIILSRADSQFYMRYYIEVIQSDVVGLEYIIAHYRWVLKFHNIFHSIYILNLHYLVHQD